MPKNDHQIAAERTPGRDEAKALFERITLVIPAYDPSTTVVDLVKRLLQNGFVNVVVVDDGSSANSATVFSAIDKISGVTMLRHRENRGKGAALKSAFRFITDHLAKDTDWVITLDADGQHRVEDVVKLAKASSGAHDRLILGIRDFTGSVPLRSKFGNLLTRFVLRLFSQVELKDTQTGLRSLPLPYLYTAQQIRADRYDFELECILEAKRAGLSLEQLPIETIYIDNNALSHFRPIVDSMRIYSIFLRHLAMSILSFGIDITAFTIIYALGGNIIGSTYLARIISGSINFYFNKTLVFHSHERKRVVYEAFFYVGLAILVATASGVAVEYIASKADWSVPLVKVVVDAQLFVLSFLAQRLVIFNPAFAPSTKN